MSQEIKDVCVCFRPPLELSDAVLVTRRLLEDFPSRILPEFKPWFADSRRAIRPQRRAPVIGPEEKRRCWCVTEARGVSARDTHSLSGPFVRMVERLGLDPRHRVCWELEERHCTGVPLERLFTDIGRCIRHARLPSCNAHFQRAQSRIRIYCDVRFCQHIGLVLKQEFRLAGRIHLSAHKLGHILSF